MNFQANFLSQEINVQKKKAFSGGRIVRLLVSLWNMAAY